MKLHELKIKHEYLIDVALGNKTFELRYNDRDYQVGDLIRFIDISVGYTSNDVEPYIDENTLDKNIIDILESSLGIQFTI